MSVQLKIQYLPHYQSTWERIHYKHTDDSGFDLRAAIDAPVLLKAHEICLIPCGIKIEMAHDSSTPYFYELQIRARSGLASKHGIGVANGPGTVDYGYRGEIMVPLIGILYEFEAQERVIRQTAAEVFKEEGIEIPFNQLDVNVISQK